MRTLAACYRVILGARMIARWLALSALLLVPVQARAADDSLPMELDYQETSSCPGEAEFFDGVRARAPRVRRAGAGEPAYGVRVRYSASRDASPDRSIEGELQLRDPDNHRARRRIAGALCSDVARALALVVALEIAEVAIVPPSVPAADRPQDVARAPVAAHWAPMVAIGAGVRGGVAAGPSFASAIAFGMDLEGPTSWLAPSFRLGVSYAAGSADVASVDNDTLALRLATLVMDACLPRWSLLDHRLRIMACGLWEAGFQLAELQPRGLGTGNAPWMATGLVARARARVTTAVFVEAEAAGVIPLTRTRFFETGAKSPIFVSPSVTGRAALNIGMSFP